MSVNIPIYDAKDWIGDMFIQKLDDDISRLAKEAIEEVEKDGLEAIKMYNRKKLGRIWENPIVSREDIENAWDGLSQKEVSALKEFEKQIRLKSGKQVQQLQDYEVNLGDYNILYKWLPIRNIGIYSSPDFPTTLINVATMANIAGVRRIVLSTFPRKKNKPIDPGILVAADMCNIKEIYCMKGRRAIAALTVGLRDKDEEILSPIDMICGPGNVWVDATKRYVAMKYGKRIDLPAGPSEVVVVADETADKRKIALEMMCQAEHGSTSRSISITTSSEYAKQYVEEINSLLGELANYPRKNAIIKSLNTNGKIIISRDLKEVKDIIDRISPEMLVFYIQNEWKRYFEDNLPVAATVCMGLSSAESDYGPETCISPTAGGARSYSKLRVMDFLRLVPTISRSSYDFLNDQSVLAELEGFKVHKRALEYARVR